MKTESSEPTDRRGECLCGAVSLSAPMTDHTIGACHCRMCRRWGGGPFLSVDCGTALAIDGEEHVRIYDSSAWAERGFCARCGTHLFYRLKETGEYSLPVGIFESDAGLTFTSQIFIDQKPDYYSFADDTSVMTESEVFAKYGAQ